MGNLDSSMGFSVNEDGSITRTGCSPKEIKQNPNFIPVSISKFTGILWKQMLYIFCYIVLLLATAMSLVWLFVRLICENDSIILVISPFIVMLIVDLFVGIPLIKSFPSKNNILKTANYVQSNLKSNFGYPYIMTDNHIGVLNTHIKKVIVPPNYDCIYWVIPQGVLCAEINDEKIFYDINGNVLTNVPASYHNSKISI